MPAPLVFFDIAGPDLAALAAFYKAVFDWDSGPTGALEVQVNGPGPGRFSGTFRQDPADCMLYFGVPDVTAALEQVVAHGGGLIAPRFAVPGVVILGLFTDPAGNRVGLVETEGGKAKIP